MSGYEIAALALAAGGTAASVSAQQKQARERRRTLNRQMERTEESTKKATDLIQNEGERFSPDARAAELAAAEEAAVTRSKQDLEGAGGATIATAGDAGNVSTDFLTAKADRAISEGSRLTALSRELAKIRAPGQIQTDDRMSTANLASRLSNIQGTNANLARANSMDAESIEAPAYGQLGSIASSLAGGYLRSGSAAAGGAGGGQIAWGGPAVGTSTIGATGGAQLARGYPAVGFGAYR